MVFYFSGNRPYGYISYMLLHNKLPKIQQLKSINILCCFCWSEIWKQLSQVVLAKAFFLPNCSYCIGLVYIHLKVRVVLMNLLPVRVTHTPGKYVLADGRRPQFLAIQTSPQSCLSFLMIWQLASRQSDERCREEEKLQYFLCPRLGSHTLSLLSYLLINLLISFHLLGVSH